MPADRENAEKPEIVDEVPRVRRQGGRKQRRNRKRQPTEYDAALIDSADRDGVWKAKEVLGSDLELIRGQINAARKSLHIVRGDKKYGMHLETESDRLVASKPDHVKLYFRVTWIEMD